MLLRTTIAVCVLLALPLGAWADEPYAKYDALLKKYVDDEGMVDYAAFKENDEATLRACVKDMARAVVSLSHRSVTKESSFALWINVYNAVTLQAMLEFYPLKSITDKNSKNYDVWKDYRFGQKKISLNDIEHKILRPMGDPRIHAAIVCASKGCPILLNEAYVPDRLSEQLDKNVRKWFKDPKRGLSLEGDTVYISQIFNWFGGDFAKDRARQLEWIAKYVDKKTAAAITRRGLKVKFIEWDWSLNEQ